MCDVSFHKHSHNYSSVTQFLGDWSIRWMNCIGKYRKRGLIVSFESGSVCPRVILCLDNKLPIWTILFCIVYEPPVRFNHGNRCVESYIEVRDLTRDRINSSGSITFVIGFLLFIFNPILASVPTFCIPLIRNCIFVYHSSEFIIFIFELQGHDLAFSIAPSWFFLPYAETSHSLILIAHH